MSSPMFDGQYRSKPLISLRGASRQVRLLWFGGVQVHWFLWQQVERGGLLEKAQKEREFREVGSYCMSANCFNLSSFRVYADRNWLP